MLFLHLVIGCIYLIRRHLILLLNYLNLLVVIIVLLEVFVMIFLSMINMDTVDLKSKLLHLLLDFTELTTASVYRVTVMHPYGCSPDATIVISRCIVKISQFYLCTEAGDVSTSYLVVSHLSPVQFETLLQKSFDMQIKPFRRLGIYNLVF